MFRPLTSKRTVDPNAFEENIGLFSLFPEMLIETFIIFEGILKGGPKILIHLNESASGLWI